MAIRKLRYLIIILGAGIILTGATGLYWHRRALSARWEDPCLSYHDQRQWIICYNQKVHEIGEAQGTAAALQFAKEAIVKRRPYAVIHFVMHILGRDAYYNTRDIQKGLAYLPPDAFEPENFLNYDGYKHGLFQAFFYENRDVEDNPTLYQKACPTLELSSPKVDTVSYLDTVSYGESPVENCFHSIGHALMYANGNEVLKTVAQCEELPRANMRYWCYIGVFMENSYLHSNFLYDQHAPRPFVKEDAMVSLCKSFNDEEKAGLCSQYVGRAYWIMYYPDVQGALKQCHLVTPEYINRCLRQVIIYPLAGFFRDDYERIIEMCESLDPIYRRICINGAASGIARGVGGPNAKKEKFCGMVEEVFRQECLHAK